MTDEERIADLVARTLQWAIDQADAPSLSAVAALDIGEVELTDIFSGKRFRLIVEEITE